MSTSNSFGISDLDKTLNSSLNWKFWFFKVNMPIKGTNGLQQKNEHLYWILHIQISLGAKFQLKLTIFTFWITFTEKRYFWSKTQKSEYHHSVLNIIISVGTKFQIGLAILIFGLNLLKKGISSVKNKKIKNTWILEIQIKRRNKL